jgi:CarboxypepD_reg-like domain/Secretion system C-terminal sorting domain
MFATPPSMQSEQLSQVLLGGMIAVHNGYYKYNYTIRGVIRDGNNNPVPSAAVMIKDTKRGVVSDVNGAFTIRINEVRSVVLRVSYVGYETQDVKIDNRAAQSSVNINVNLKEMVMGLMGDVVISRVKKRSLFNYFKKDSIKMEAPRAKQTLTIYPNPVIKGTDIKMSIDNLQEGNYRLSVYDVMGNPVAGKEIKITGSNSKESLLCDQRFAGGIYVISLTGNGKTISSKIIVQ